MGAKILTIAEVAKLKSIKVTQADINKAVVAEKRGEASGGKLVCCCPIFQAAERIGIPVTNVDFHCINVRDRAYHVILADDASYFTRAHSEDWYKLSPRTINIEAIHDRYGR